MKKYELERLYCISAQLKNGIEHISIGQVEMGKLLIQVAHRDLSILLTMASAENSKELPDN